MAVFELPKQPGDLTFQDTCKVIWDEVYGGKVMVSFWDETGADVLWHDSRVGRFLRENPEISHYRSGGQRLTDAGYEEKFQLKQSRQTFIDLCTNPEYAHLYALSWTPREWLSYCDIDFVLYHVCSQDYHIGLLSVEYIRKAHNYKWLRELSKRLGMKRYASSRMLDGVLQPSEYEVYTGQCDNGFNGYAATVDQRHSQVSTTDYWAVREHFYGGGAPA